MTSAQLAAHNLADRRRVLEAAIREARRGIDVRVNCGACSIDAHRRNLARLEAELAALPGAAA